MLILLLCSIFSVAHTFGHQDVNLYASIDIGDPLVPIVRTGRYFVKNLVEYEQYENWKTGGIVNVTLHAVGHGTWIGTAREYPQLGFYWGHSYRFEDGYPDEAPYACASYDHENEPNEHISVGETKNFNNGSVIVNCGTSSSGVRRVSEAVTGCFFNNTVYKLGKQWEEPIIGEKYFKIMECAKSNEGYFENKVVGCSIPHSLLYKDLHITSSENIWLNTTYNFYLDDTSKKCVETEPGIVKIVEVRDEEGSKCYWEGEARGYRSWTDEKRGAILNCWINGKPLKEACLIGNERIGVGKEVKLVNGCTFLCHPQTNIYKCDNSMNMFEVAGKIRKSKR